VSLIITNDCISRTDCQCHKNVIPALQSLVKDFLEFYNQEKTTPRDLKNSQYELFGEFTEYHFISDRKFCGLARV